MMKKTTANTATAQERAALMVKTAQLATAPGLIAAGTKMTMTHGLMTTEATPPEQIRDRLRPVEEHQYEGF